VRDIRTSRKNPEVFYFAFGSNLSTVQMRERCPGCEPDGPALLRGRALGFAYRSQNFPPGGAADVVQDEQGEVWGAIYRLGASDLERLDRFEHIGNGGYRRIEVEVEGAGGRVRALCYEVADRLGFDIPPTPAYRRLMLDGALEHGLPGDWSAQLKRRFDSMDAASSDSRQSEGSIQSASKGFGMGLGKANRYHSTKPK
jgi:gamma-glutamylcyclotransferase